MSKISAYTAWPAAATNDLLVVVDVSDTSMAATGTDKKATLSQVRAVDWYNVVNDYGADPTGVADSTTAIQAAITAAVTARLTTPSPLGGSVVVYIPAGNYLISSPLAVTGGVHICGGGYNSRLFSNSSGLFDFGTTSFIHFELDHLTLDATGGHIFTNINLKRSSLHHLVLIQRSGGFTIGTFGTTGTTLATSSVENVIQYAYPDPVSNVRTVPWWQLLVPGSKNIDAVAFRKVISLAQPNTNGAFDNTQFVFDMACTSLAVGGVGDRVTFDQCDFGTTLGGAIRLRSVQGVLLNQIGTGNIYDQGTPSHTVGNSMIYVGNYPGAPASAAARGTTITGYTHESAGTITWGTFANIEAASDSTATTIIAPMHTDAGTNGNTLRINLNGSASALIDNPTSGYTLLNAAGDTIVTGSGDIQMSGQSVITNDQQPGVAALLAWNFDPCVTQATGAALTSQSVYAMRVDIYKPVTVGHLWFNITATGSGATAGQNFIGLYNAAGTQIAQAGIDASVTGTGTQKIAVTANGGQTLSLVPGSYWVMILIGATGMPSLLRGSASIAAYNIGTTAATLRAGVAATLATALPSPATMSGLVTGTAAPFWVGLAV